MKKILALLLTFSLLWIALATPSFAVTYQYEAPVEPQLWKEPDFSTEHDFSIALIGDTQFLTLGDAYCGTKKMNKLYQVLADTAEERKLEHVFVVGDMTHNGYHNDANLAHSYVDPPSTTEWEIAQEAILQLSDAGISYSLCRGNHDDYMMDDYFNIPAYTDQFKGVGGFFSDSNAKHPTCREKDNPEGYIYWSAKSGHYENSVVNSYKTMKICGKKFIFITVDFNPTENVLNWVDRILGEYSDHHAIIATHSYLVTSGALNDSEQGDTKYPLGYTADVFWDRVLQHHKNVLMVACGHVGVTRPVYSTQIGVHGNTVHQIMVNPQKYETVEKPDGTISTGKQDTGMVLYLNFSDNGSKVTFDYYSTLLNKEMTDTDRTITLYEKDSYGDLDQNGSADQDDAILLLYHAIFPDRYPLAKSGDLNGDGKVTVDDAIYLLYHVNFPQNYPLSK